MSNNYDRKITDTYTILRSKADKTRTMDVVNGESEKPIEYSTSKQAQEVFDSLKDKYVMGYATMYDIRSLSKFGEGDVNYGEVSKLLKRIFPENTKMSLEKYSQLFGIEEEDELEQIKALYEVLKETAKRYNLEEDLFGKGKKPIDLTVEQIKLVYEDLKAEESEPSFNIFEEMGEDGDLIDSWERDGGMSEPEDSAETFKEEPADFEDLTKPVNFDESEEPADFEDLIEPVNLDEHGDNEDLTEPVDFDESEKEEEPADFEDLTEPVNLDESEDNEDLTEPVEFDDAEEPFHEEEEEDDTEFEVPVTMEFMDTEKMDDITVHVTETAEGQEQEENDEALSKEEVMSTLERIYMRYKNDGHFLWTKWLALQISRVEDDNADVTEEFHVASAELEDNFLKELYFHLRDDLQAEMSPEMTEYSARTQIMGMCLEAFATKEAHRIYSEISEGMYIEFVLNQPESLQAKEVKDLAECDLDPKWEEIYAPLVGGEAFPLEREYYEPEVDVEGYEVKEDIDNMEFKEVDVLPQPIEELDFEEPLREEIESDPLYAVCEEPVSPLLVPEEEEEEKKPKKKKKKGIFRKTVRAILWLILVSCMAVLGYASYALYNKTEDLEVENIQLSHKLNEAEAEIIGLRELEPYKDREELFEKHIMNVYKAKKFSYAKTLVEAYYGKDVAKMPETIKPVYNMLVKAVK